MTKFIHSCYTRDENVHIKNTEHSKTLEVYHMNFLCGAFSEFEFFENDGSEHFHDLHLMILVNRHIDLTNNSCCV